MASACCQGPPGLRQRTYGAVSVAQVGEGQRLPQPVTELPLDAKCPVEALGGLREVAQMELGVPQALPDRPVDIAIPDFDVGMCSGATPRESTNPRTASAGVAGLPDGSKPRRFTYSCPSGNRWPPGAPSAAPALSSLPQRYPAAPVRRG
jgi:hypothetical protein